MLNLFYATSMSHLNELEREPIAESGGERSIWSGRVFRRSLGVYDGFYTFWLTTDLLYCALTAETQIRPTQAPWATMTQESFCFPHQLYSVYVETCASPWSLDPCDRCIAGRLHCCPPFLYTAGIRAGVGRATCLTLSFCLSVYPESD